MESIKRYLQFVKPYKWQIIGTVLIGLLKFAIPLLIPLLSKYIVDDIINSDLSTDMKSERLLWAMGIMLFIFVAVRPPIEYYRQYFAQWTGTKILYDIRNDLFTHVQKLSFKYYSNTRVGEVISRMITDVEQTKNFVITGLMNLWLRYRYNYNCNSHYVYNGRKVNNCIHHYAAILRFFRQTFFWKAQIIQGLGLKP